MAGRVNPALNESPLKRVTLIDSVELRLSELIVSGEIAPDTKLPGQDTLARQFGVSRPVVREALARLGAQGLVDTINGSGTYVRRPRVDNLATQLLHHLRLAQTDPNEFRLLYDARIGVEMATARLAATRSTATDRRQLASTLRAMRGATTPAESMTADIDFHLAVGWAAHNPFLYSLIAPLIDAIRRVMSEIVGIAKARSEAIAGHEAVRTAIAARDADAAGEAMREHLEVSYRYASRVFTKQ